MTSTWHPPSATPAGGEAIAAWSGRDWTVEARANSLAVGAAGKQRLFTPVEVTTLEVRRRWFRRELHTKAERVTRLSGLKRPEVEHLQRHLSRLRHAGQIDAAVAWHTTYEGVIGGARSAGRWISREQREHLEATRPPQKLAGELERSGAARELAEAQWAAAVALDADLCAVVEHENDAILASELSKHSDFFDRIERSPLTDEQARAVVCFDNRVHVLAAAGSGKTSLMVARAAYAINRGFVSPDKVLLLAFNKAAAAELQERIEARLKVAGVPSEGVRASTFHSFGLDVIGKATGKRPRLASWLGVGDEIRMVMQIVDELCDRDRTFRYKWDLYRLLFASSASDLEDAEPDAWDAHQGLQGYRTFRGEVVRSEGERMIANWLYLNGVPYEYERPYVVDVADETHSQYRPDFYYPDIDVWHEHWALDRSGEPPQEFVGYAAGIDWKRRLHAQHSTDLIETTWANVVFGDGLQQLGKQLERRGVELDWNPDRPIEAVRPVEHDDLARTVRTFMTHVKSNSLNPGEILRRLEGGHGRLSGFRTMLFLDVYWPIHDEWNRKLQAEGSVDFEDMLVMASQHLESGQVEMGYELVMVDEFQDASQARARLVRGLLRERGRYLLAVGDDWQAINRFAGADLSVMLDFEEWFGDGPTLTLSTTFRCPQSICDVASGFVMKNPRQFRKTVKSARHGWDDAVSLVRSDDTEGAIVSCLERLSVRLAEESGQDERATVDVLGRYHFLNHLVPAKVPKNLDVRFRTVHGSKGLEADYVLIPGLVSGTYGFPSTIIDSPVLDLAMAAGDEFPHAEERRLMYVALTRARRRVTLFTEPGRESRFATELMQELPEVVVDTDGVAAPPPQVCTKCGHGTMVRRTGKFGPFMGCSKFPACKNTSPVPVD